MSVVIQTGDAQLIKTMRTLLVVCVVALAAAAHARPEDTYNPAYDNFDAQELVENVRLLKGYGKCFLDKGPCTPEGNEFKKRIPEALRTSCGKCSPRQRQLIRTVVRGFQEKLPDVWHELSLKNDPSGQYKDSFNQFLNAKD